MTEPKLKAAEAINLTGLATLQASEPAPGPGSRITRTAGQAGGVLAFIDLWHAFGWAGADHWTAAQAGTRWPALGAVAIVAVSAAHNGLNWWMTNRRLGRLGEIQQDG